MKPIIISIIILSNVLNFELAITEQEKTKGLMYRKNWGNIDGMLFIHEKPQPVVYWMKNTYLEMYTLFIDDKYSLTEIKKPKILSEDLIFSSSNNIKYVLELNPLHKDLVIKNYNEFKFQISNKITELKKKKIIN